MSRLSTKQRRAARRRGLGVFFDGCEWWVARSAAAAVAAQIEMGVDARDTIPAEEWEELERSRCLTMMCDAVVGGVERTVAEWVKVNGPGLLGSTEW